MEAVIHVVVGFAWISITLAILSTMSGAHLNYQIYNGFELAIKFGGMNGV
jgi:hypothetical protein